MKVWLINKRKLFAFFVMMILAVITVFSYGTKAYAADGYIDLAIYIYDGGKLAEGYRAQIDETVLVANDKGQVVFKQLTVEPHTIIITNKDGKTSSATYNLYDSSTTEYTGSGMLGEYDIGISSMAQNAYMEVAFVADYVTEIKSVSESAPSLQQSSLPNNNGDDAEENTNTGDNKEGGQTNKEDSGGITPMLLLIAVVVCVIIIGVLVVLLKKGNNKGHRAESPTGMPRTQTGGKNKFEDRSKF